MQAQIFFLFTQFQERWTDGKYLLHSRVAGNNHVNCGIPKMYAPIIKFLANGLALIGVAAFADVALGTGGGDAAPSTLGSGATTIGGETPASCTD